MLDAFDEFQSIQLSQLSNKSLHKIVAILVDHEPVRFSQNLFHYLVAQKFIWISLHNPL